MIYINILYIWFFYIVYYLYRYVNGGCKKNYKILLVKGVGYAKQFFHKQKERQKICIPPPFCFLEYYFVSSSFILLSFSLR